MKTLTALFLLLSAFGLNACQSSGKPVRTVFLSPPAEDLKDQPEPEGPNPITATKAEKDAYHEAILLWGRSLQDALARVRKWVEERVNEAGE